ncbi:hypothetical protein EVAR_49562_1 [Eumeta japonica]|uniref:Uncharacterized protein n=1 Tax=Eumeta variegata TaxID=151549 RepID=A0A4C1XMK1_EUMVA|nr:hypothetical protein EVAR_49562_1 [Eumeta japonica]
MWRKGSFRKTTDEQRHEQGERGITDSRFAQTSPKVCSATSGELAAKYERAAAGTPLQGGNRCPMNLLANQTEHICKARKCSIEGSAETYHSLLYSARPTTEGKKEMEMIASTHRQKPSASCAFLKIVPVRVTGPRGHVGTHALLDDGFTVMLFDAALATRIGVEGPMDDAVASRRIIEKRDLERCRHLRNKEEFLKYGNAQPSIGQDKWHLLVADRMRRGSRTQLAASRTPIGWVLHSTHTRSLGQRVHYVHHVAENNIEEIDGKYFHINSLDFQPRQLRSNPKKER